MKYIKMLFSTLLMISIFCFTAVTFTGCDKKDDDHHSGPDTQAPVFNITSPTPMQVFNNGDTVFLRGTLTDDKSLHDLEILIKNADNDSTLFSLSQSVHDLTSYNIDFFWKSSVSDHTNAHVIFMAEDHGGNIGRDTVHIHIMP
ncbi:MAG: hypothetical protein KatS3mg031_1424 [Chitinophagales bacterium]|nr:MAG: hypothetical protein KatS3mg031_1424 [Chitinophagales bacterium]